MNHLRWLITTVLVLTVHLGGGCSKNDAEITENFTSQAQADSAVLQNSNDILNIAHFVDDIPNAFDFNGSFDRAKLNHDKLLSKGRFSKTHFTNSGGYNASTGFWTYDSIIGDTYNVHAKIKFIPHGLDGLPDSTTDAMTISENGSVKFSDEVDNKLTFTFTIASDVTGIKAYKNLTGNATMNGSFNTTQNGITSRYVNENTVIVTMEDIFNADYHTVLVSPSATYPIQGGSIDFTLKYNEKPLTLGYLTFFVSGTITFDGTHIAKRAVGGFNYNIDLDNDTITPL